MLIETGRDWDLAWQGRALTLESQAICAKSGNVPRRVRQVEPSQARQVKTGQGSSLSCWAIAHPQELWASFRRSGCLKQLQQSLAFMLTLPLGLVMPASVSMLA